MKVKVDRDALLEAFRAQRGPGRDAEERLWARLEADIEASSRGVWTPVRSRRRAVWAFAALTAVAAAAVVMVWPHGRTLDVESSDETPSLAAHERGAASDAPVTEPSPQRPRPVASEEPIHTDPMPEAELEDRAEPGATGSVAEVDPRPAPERPSSRRRPPRSAVAQDSLAEETRLLRQARSALGQGDPQRALAVLSAYEQAHPKGLLAEEAAAVRTIAKCRMQPSAGRELARSFSTRHRGSLFRGQVQAACAIEGEEK